MAVGRCREIIAAARSTRQQIADSQSSGHVDRLRNLIAVDEAHHLGRRLSLVHDRLPRYGGAHRSIIGAARAIDAPPNAQLPSAPPGTHPTYLSAGFGSRRHRTGVDPASRGAD